MSGSIPEELGALNSLLFLYLHGNQLSGSIPEELGALGAVTRLYLYDNQLSGPIPPALGQLSNLQYLILHGNQLSGSIPEELGALNSLLFLYLHGNQLSGSLPTELGDLSTLRNLKLHSNAALSGVLPASFPTGLASLSELQLQNTLLTVPPDTVFTTWLGTVTVTQGARTSTDSVALAADNTAPDGLWSNGTTLWVVDNRAATVFAYRLASGTRDASKDIPLAADHTHPYGLWGDGTTVWIAQDGSSAPSLGHFGDKLLAYTLATGARNPTKDIVFPADTAGTSVPNGAPRGLWSDGTTVWVMDSDDDKLYAYTLPDRRPDHHGQRRVGHGQGHRPGPGQWARVRAVGGRHHAMGHGPQRRAAVRLHPAGRRPGHHGRRQVGRGQGRDS